MFFHLVLEFMGPGVGHASSTLPGTSCTRELMLPPCVPVVAEEPEMETFSFQLSCGTLTLCGVADGVAQRAPP